MCNNFGVGFTFKGNSASDKFVFKFNVVFDNSVVNYCKSTLKSRVRMGVSSTGRSVSCPTGVTDTYLTRNIFTVVGFTL